jgi:acetoin utilization protein AcuB
MERWRIARSFEGEHFMRDEPLVSTFMTAKVQSLSPDDRLLEAALLMRSSHFRHIPIVEDGQLVGILTDRDIQRCTPSLLARVSPEEYNAIFEETEISRVMTREPLKISPDAPLVEAVTLLREKKLGCLPVVENGKLVGIITKADMLSALLRILESAQVTR